MPDNPRFYLDEMVHEAVADGLKLRGIDVLTTVDAGYLGRSDDDQLAFAHGEQRVIFTMDDDYLVLAAEGREHSGIAYLHPTSFTVGRVVHGLARLHRERTSDEMRGVVVYL